MQLYLEHIIRETGHRHGAALEEVAPDILDYLRPLLRRTLNTSQTVQLPYTAWYLHAQTRDGRLFVSLWWGLADSAPPLTMQVEQSEPPRCTVSITDSATLDVLAAAEAGELERSIAWAWLIEVKGINHAAPRRSADLDRQKQAPKRPKSAPIRPLLSPGAC